MLWLGFAAGILCVAVLLWRRVGRARAATGSGADVAPYEEIKRRIRAGAVQDEARPEPARALPEPRPPEEIFRLQGNEFLWALMERVAIKSERAGAPPLTPSEGALLYVMNLESEVNNGGFDQYFFNSSGDNAREALDGLELIEARQAAEIVRRAIGTFGDAGPSRSREARWRQMDLWSDEDKSKVERLDDEFFAYPDPIPDLLEKHCREHRADFESGGC